MQEVYDRYGRALIRKAERILGSRDDALDVVHSLFVDLVDEPADRDLDLPYLYRAVTNRCLTLLRDEKNRTRLLAEHDVALRGPVRTRLDDRAVDLDLLAKLVARLDAVEGEILALHVFDDMTQDEIAGVVALSRKTVGKKLERIAEVVPLGMDRSPYPDRVVPKPGFEKELAQRTLTNLYNQRPAWLAQAHAALDAAVAAAYGWADYSPALADDEILRRLLALNLQRAAAQ